MLEKDMPTLSGLKWGELAVSCMHAQAQPPTNPHLIQSKLDFCSQPSPVGHVPRSWAVALDGAATVHPCARFLLLAVSHALKPVRL
jgi:hypothetical protein